MIRQLPQIGGLLAGLMLVTLLVGCNPQQPFYLCLYLQPCHRSVFPSFSGMASYPSDNGTEADGYRYDCRRNSYNIHVLIQDVRGLMFAL